MVACSLPMDAKSIGASLEEVSHTTNVLESSDLVGSWRSWKSSTPHAWALEAHLTSYTAIGLSNGALAEKGRGR